jgi:hypothetical protein
MSFSFLQSKLLRFSGVITLVSSWVLIIFSLFKLRPVQDDYLVLKSIASAPVREFLVSIWNQQGGNLFPYLINSLLLYPSRYQLNFIGIKAFYIVTLLAVIFAQAVLFKLVTGRNLIQFGKTFAVFYLTLTAVGFEGIFVPTFIGSYSFSLASLAHLWPVILFVFAVYCLVRRNSYLPLPLVLGFIIGNSNAAESFSALLISIALMITAIINRKTDILRLVHSILLTLGVLFGFLFMVLSPGFSNRASTSVGFPDSIIEFFYRFGKALVSFFTDSITHPASYVALVFGAWVASFVLENSEKRKIGRNYLILLACYFLLLINLIAGGTLAYTSWHQAFGLEFLLVPVWFGSGIFLSQTWPPLAKRLPQLLLVTSILLAGFNLRAGINVGIRAEAWDASYRLNYCSIEGNKRIPLSGAELRYPPLGLGIEDIQSWPWMRSGYVQWLKQIEPSDSLICD